METPAGGGATSSAAFFDLDKTVISRSSTLAFAPSFYQHGLISKTQVLRGALAQLVFRAGGASPGQMERIREQVTRLCRGWPAERVSQIVSEHLADIIGPLIYDQARSLLDSHRAAGRDVFIVSTSGQEMVGPISHMLGASGTIATRMRIVDGHYTGEIDFYAYGPAKATGVRELAAQRGYNLPACFAYSDSATDIPLLEAVGRPHAVNPDRELRRVARERGWPVLEFGAASARGMLAARSIEITN